MNISPCKAFAQTVTWTVSFEVSCEQAVLTVNLKYTLDFSHRRTPMNNLFSFFFFFLAFDWNARGTIDDGEGERNQPWIAFCYVATIRFVIAWREIFHLDVLIWCPSFFVVEKKTTLEKAGWKNRTRRKKCWTTPLWLYSVVFAVWCMSDENDWKKQDFRACRLARHRKYSVFILERNSPEMYLRPLKTIRLFEYDLCACHPIIHRSFVRVPRPPCRYSGLCLPVTLTWSAQSSWNERRKFNLIQQ